MCGCVQGLLAGHFEELKWTASIGSLVKTKVFTSIDERLCFNIFTFAVHGQPMAVPEHMVLGTSANSKGAAASTAASASSSSSNAPSHSSNDCAFAERIFATAPRRP